MSIAVIPAPIRLPLSMTRRALLGALILAPFAGVAARAARRADAPVALSQNDRADLKRIAAYLDGIHTMRARFEQKASDGGLASGTIYLQRPGLMRVEYDAPAHALLVADGVWVTYYDSELDQRTQIPIAQSPLWFLLQDKIDFTPATTVTRIERSAGLLRVSLYQTGHPDGGSISLTLADNPLQLTRWTAGDSQGTQIDIALHDVVFSLALASDLFATPHTRNHRHGQRIVE
jgi:outer membrane lipoprotein-sorting protein